MTHRDAPFATDQPEPTTPEFPLSLAISVKDHLEDNPDLVTFFRTHPKLLSAWVVLSTSVDAGRSRTLVLNKDSSLLAVDHAGSEVLDIRELLTQLDGTVPTTYWSDQYRTFQAFWVLAAIDGRPTRAQIEALLGPAFSADTFNACQASRGTK